MGANWLLMDVSHVGEVRIASVSPERPIIEQVTRFASDGLPTFTDALLRFERETRQRLFGMTAVVAIAGAPVGESIPIARTRWNISRPGLASMTGQSAIVLNEVSAHAWATVGTTTPAFEAVRGTGLPDLRAKGRHLFLALSEGLGTAILDVDDTGHVTVLEAEGGHADFAPQNEAELALARALAPFGGGATWEQVLMLRRDSAAARALGPLSEQQFTELRAALLGRFVAITMLITGAWSGVMMTGSAIPRFDAATRRAFDGGLTERRAFPRLFNAARAWRVEQREPVLSGAATLMVQRHRSRTGA